MSRNQQTWALEDHLCKSCGGRILRCVSGGGPTGGGNPIYRCADCGIGGASMGPQAICWCGMAFRRNEKGAYRCLPFSILEGHPEYLSAFLACGCDPARGGDVGVVLNRSIRGAKGE